MCLLMNGLTTGVGRFTQQDTWDGRLRQPATLNKYVYANTDPVNTIDPTGNFGIASFGTATNIRSTLASTSVPNLSFAISRAVGASLQVSGRAATKTALRTLRQCIKKKNKCGLRINLLIIGYDNPTMVDHIRDAQTATTVVLTYVKNKKGNRSWYRNKGACKLSGPPGYQCDEYPFFQTKENTVSTATVSLRWVPASENGSVGGHFGALAGTMKSPKNRFEKTSQALASACLCPTKVENTVSNS